MVGDSVGQGRAGRAKVGQTNDDRGKDVVPFKIHNTYECTLSIYISMRLNWLKDQLRMLSEESLAQRERVKLWSPPPKKCCFHSRVYIF